MRFITFLFINLAQRKARSLLTTCGVAVAIGTTVALLGISYGFERATIRAFGERGVEIVIVEEGVLDQLNSDLDEAHAARIAQVPGVGRVAPGLVELLDYSKEGNVISVLLNGWAADAFLWDDLKIIAGRRNLPDEDRVVLLGRILAENLGKQVGDTLDIRREPFEVIGIYESFSVFENGAIAAPLAAAQQLASREGRVTGFSVMLDHSGPQEVSVDEVCRQINALTDEEGRSLGLSAMPTRDYATSAMHIRLAHAMAWLTSAIALLVGGIGMLNTMLMSVIERIREISILRAIGWRKSRVVRMVLGECLILCLSGAALGTLGAMALVWWLTKLPAARGFIDGTIAPLAIVQGFAMAVAVGLVGGIYPAYRAVGLLPTQGLAHE